MKKTYQIPVVRTVAISQRYHLMEPSVLPYSLRNAEGADNTLPTSVKSSSMSPVQDMFGNSQDEGGIRSREFDWED